MAFREAQKELCSVVDHLTYNKEMANLSGKDKMFGITSGTSTPSSYAYGDIKVRSYYDEVQGLIAKVDEEERRLKKIT